MGDYKRSPYFEIFNEETRSNIIVYNRFLNRRELGLVIRELWNEKIKNDFEKRLIGKKRIKMNEFCILYFSEKYKSAEIANEWFINIKEACKRFKDFEDAQFLLFVLNNEIDEEIYHSFMELVGKLYLRMNKNLNNIEKSLRETFPKKSNEKIKELVEAAAETKQLFSQSDDGKLNKFLKTIKSQNENERIEFLSSIVLKLDYLEHIYIEDFIKCLKEIDMNITDVKINSYSEWIFNQSENNQYFIHKTEFIKKLKSVNIY